MRQLLLKWFPHFDQIEWLFGSDKQDRQTQKGILTLTSWNGLPGSDQQGCQNGEAPHFSAAKPQVWM